MRMAELSLALSMLVTVLVLTQNASALQALGQIPINITLSPGDVSQQTLIIYNDANETFSSTVNITGNASQVVRIITDTITISPFSLGTIYYNVSVPSDGFWSGMFQIGSLNVPIYVYGQVFRSTSWYQSGKDITIQPGDYKISIQNVTQTSAYLLIFQHGYMIQSKSFSVGDEFSTPEIKIKVLDLFQDMVKLEITSKYLNTQVSVSEGAEGISGGFMNFGFYTTQYANTITTDSDLKETFILRNGLNEPVTLKTVEYSGTIITSEGRQPINAVQYNLGVLNPGEEAIFVVEINTKGLSPGVWTPIMTVKGLTQSGRIVSSAISFILTVTKAVVSPSPSNISVDYPKEIVANQKFNITVSGLSSGMNVEMENNPHLIGEGVTFEGGKWIWTGYVDVNETQTVTLYVKLLGGILKTLKFDLVYPKPPEPVTIVAPDKIWVGDPLTVATNPSDAKVTINGTEYSPGFTFFKEGTYVIHAEAKNYSPAEKTIIVIRPVTANVSASTTGKEATITFSQEGAYTVKYNGTVITSTTSGKTLTFTPSQPGIYEVYDDLGHQITTFEVKKAGFELALPSLSLSDYILVGLFAVLIVLIIIYLKRRGGGRIHFQTEPISTKFELEE
jgi:hypothetical protein